MRADRQALRAVSASPVAVGALLDSFAIGGVYTVLPRGGYWGGSSYARSPEKDVYAGTINQHPTGLAFPIGLPVRVLAEGRLISRSTPAFQADYCARYGATEPRCAVASFTYTIHGLADGPGVPRPYEPGMGLALTWSRSAGYYDRFYGLFPNAEFFRGRVPAADTATVRELHFRRNGCCYLIPYWNSTAWETYEGSWRFGAVPDDGGQAELGVAAVLRLHGPRTDAPLAALADFAVATTTGDAIATTRWWYVRAANNVFDGEPVPFVTITQPWTMQITRYPDGQRTVFEELPACAGRTTCSYQASMAGAVVVQATLADGRVLAARNTGASGAHVRITADSTTLTYGDTTVFRVTAPGAVQWSVVGYAFVPLASAPGSALRAVRGNAALGATEAVSMSRHGVSEWKSTVERATSGGIPEAALPARPQRPAHFLDAEFACDDATTVICFDDPENTGYEIVTAVVDGELQRDSVLVRVLPKLVLTCMDSNGTTDANGGATVIRAQVVTCRASLAPAGATGSLTVSDWVFMSHDRWIVRRRSDLGQTFTPDSLTWTGPLVATGVVTVAATIDQSRSDSAASRVTVRPRAWTGDSIPGFPARPVVVGQGWLVPKPRRPADLGQIKWWWRANDVVDDARFHALVTEGPNAFVYFVKTMPPVLDSILVAYNEIALSRNSAFYLLQEQDNSSRVFMGSNPCYRSDVVSTDTRGKILAHEGTNWELQPPSHAGRLRQLTFERVPAAAESVFVQAESGGRQGLMNRWNHIVYELVEATIDTASGESLHRVSQVQFGSGSRVGCSFAFFVR